MWGCVIGVALAMWRFCTRGKPADADRPSPSCVKGLRMAMVFSVVTAAWLLFKLPDFNHVVRYVGAIFTNWHQAPSLPRVYKVLVFSLPVVMYHVAYLALANTRLPRSEQWSRLRPWAAPVAYGTMLFLLVVNSGTSGEFIYFQF